MPETLETQFNATTNLEGGNNKRQKIHSCLCCLVTFVVNSNWLLVPLDSILAHAVITPLEAPCRCLLDYRRKGLEQHLVPWHGNARKIKDNEDYIDTIGVDSDKELESSFPRDDNSMNYILGGPQKPDTKGMTASEEQVTLKQYRKARKSFTNKECLALMKSISNKGFAPSLQKSQLGNFKGDLNKMV
jgi:hypothetical protein